MRDRMNGDPISIRVLGTLGCFCAFITLFVGTAIWLKPNPLLDARLLIGIGAYFLGTSIGTIFLNKIAAVFLALPLAAAGGTVVVVSALHGPFLAFLLNLLICGGIMCAPVVVVYRNWGCLR